MKLSQAGAHLMHRYEGCRNRPYLCPAHIWTIGYGHVLYQQQIRLPMAKSIRYSQVTSAVLNGVFFVLCPAYLGVKALLTLLSVLHSTPV